MAIVAMKTAVVYVTEETTPGTAATHSAGDAVGVIADGIEMTGEKELIERQLLRNSISKTLPRTGMRSMSGSISVEAASGSVAGAAPDAALLFESCLGGTRALTSSPTTITTTNLTVIPVSFATGIAAGDIVMIKDTNCGTTGYHISPVSASSLNGTNDDSITLVVPCDTAPTSGSAIEKFTTFFGENSGHPSLTVSQFLEDALKREAVGVQVNSLSMDGFETGQVASFSFGLQGWNMDETLAASGLTATYGDALPPLVLDACVYKDGVALPVTSFSFNVANTVGKVMSTCAPNGVIGQRTTERAVSGSLVAYADSASVALWNAFEEGTVFSLSAAMYNPTATAGVKSNVVAVYLPQCIITAIPMANADGVAQYNVEFQCGPDAAGSEIYLGFI
jgi:hypothetical protein